jgi:tetratricopeptide (TPR) repeat protein
MAAAETLDPKDLPRDQQERRRLAGELKDKAQQAFARGELVTATLFASDLLMLYPNERAYLDVFDEIVLSTEDPLSLLPVEVGAIHVATAAGRARVLMMQRRLPEALELITAAVKVAPDLPYLHWAARWLQPGILPTLSWEILRETVVKGALQVALRVPVPPSEDDPRMPNLRAAAGFFATLREHFAGESMLWFGEVMLRRRLGEPADTLAVAEEAWRRFPQDWRICTALLNAYRDAERPDDALVQARAALALDPSDHSPLHDAAWAFLDTVRNEEAARLFGELWQRDPVYPGAQACFHYARWRAFRDRQDELALLRLRERSWWDEQAVRFADEVEPPVPYVNVLPGPGDATASAVRHLLKEVAHVVRCCGAGGSAELQLRSRHLDSPSVGLAFDLGVAALGARGTLHVEVEEVQTPDPRTDKAQLSTRIWTYEGTKASPVYPMGEPRAQQAIASIARELFGRDRWDDAARRAAQHLGPDAYHALVSVLTHPPLPEDGFDAITWTWRCQVATAVALSHLGPWETGHARAALYSMVYGPSDWITSAAVIAFGWRVLENPALRPEVEAIFGWMRTLLPEKGFTAWEVVLCDVWRAMGPASPELTAELDAWLDAYLAAMPKKNVVRPPERRYGGLNLEEYARFCAERDKVVGTVAWSGPAAVLSAFTGAPSPALVELCERFGVPLRHPATGHVHPYIDEWQEALNASGDLHERFLELQRSLALEAMGVSREEKAALDEVRQGNMDLHLRMAQAQQAQAEVASGGAADPDPEVFPGQPVARLSDYVAILKGMQQGNMMGALARYGLDVVAYGNVATAWGAKLAADPVLTEKFSRMMGY